MSPFPSSSIRSINVRSPGEIILEWQVGGSLNYLFTLFWCLNLKLNLITICQKSVRTRYLGKWDILPPDLFLQWIRPTCNPIDCSHWKAGLDLFSDLGSPLLPLWFAIIIVWSQEFPCLWEELAAAEVDQNFASSVFHSIVLVFLYAFSRVSGQSQLRTGLFSCPCWGIGLWWEESCTLTSSPHIYLESRVGMHQWEIPDLTVRKRESLKRWLIPFPETQLPL